MKILVLQLARLGDLYLSWPALRALKRNNPKAQISLLTRQKFVGAVEGLEVLEQVLVLPTSDVLAPLVQDRMDVAEAHRRLAEFVASLRAEGFDRVINLSFSPVSSYLTHLLQKEGATGYSRTSDGFLAIPDDMSAYFYAQVGPGQPNRFHLAEIFATLCGVDLETSDWASPRLAVFAGAPTQPYVALHVGASESQKSLSPEKWVSILSHFRGLQSIPIVLLGSESEQAIATSLESSLPSGCVINWVGRTNLQETFCLIQKAQLLVGVDSAPMHMASLTGTRCLNLSVGRVNFWETGPRAAGSWILRAASETELHSDRVARLMVAALANKPAELGVIQLQPGTPSYQGLFPREAEFQWKLVQAIYQGTPFPEPTSEGFWESLVQLVEINAFLQEQLTALANGADLAQKAPLIDRGEEVIGAIAKLVPAWGPIIRWYQTEKIRIGPGESDAVLRQTLHVQQQFQSLLDLYSEMHFRNHAKESEGP